jgi:hypothetical protein
MRPRRASGIDLRVTSSFSGVEWRSWKAVAMVPGDNALTLMVRGASSRASERVKVETNALAPL